MQPNEVFSTWQRAQLEHDRHARETAPSPRLLRTKGFLTPAFAARVTDWFMAPATAPTDAVRRSYAALERETARLFEVVRHCLGVRVSHADEDPYENAPSCAPNCASTGR
jgi:hypothetical protein